MRRRIWAPAAVAVLVVAIATTWVVVKSSADRASPAGRTTPANTAKVEQGRLSAMVSAFGTLTYRARPDGSPYPVVNHAGGIYTQLPENGDQVGCGGVLYRVDDRPVLLLCGAVPAYRDLREGSAGKDVRQLNGNLRRLGYGADPGDDDFTATTEKAVKVLQRAKGLPVTGTLSLRDAVFLPEPVRIATVTGDVGGAARPGTRVLAATSDELHVQVSLDPSEQREVATGDRAQITLPGNVPVTGRVEGFGRVAQTPAGQDGKPADATVPTYVSLDDRAKAREFDRAPVQVQITTTGVENALSVPVTALFGSSGGGFAVEVVRAGGQRELVAVRLGLFDTAAGRVQVAGEVRAGDAVVVPSS